MSRPERSSSEKLVDLGPLAAALRGARAEGRTVVFTNGCYDLLHVGHVQLLEQAADLGDVLVVGINSDASVGRLKGPSRPILPFKDRARLLGALEVVDWVVGFDEDTPEALVRELVPDVLVKGGDWSPDRIVGANLVESRGGKVISLPLVQGRSTSSLVTRIREGRSADETP